MRFPEKVIVVALFLLGLGVVVCFALMLSGTVGPGVK